MRTAHNSKPRPCCHLNIMCIRLRHAITSDAQFRHHQYRIKGHHALSCMTAPCTTMALKPDAWPPPQLLLLIQLGTLHKTPNARCSCLTARSLRWLGGMVSSASARALCPTCTCPTQGFGLSLSGINHAPVCSPCSHEAALPCMILGMCSCCVERETCTKMFSAEYHLDFHLGMLHAIVAVDQDAVRRDVRSQ